MTPWPRRFLSAGLRAARVIAYTHYPKRQDILAALSGVSGFSGKKAWRTRSPRRAGFYYLWLPEIKERLKLFGGSRP